MTTHRPLNLLVAPSALPLLLAVTVWAFGSRVTVAVPHWSSVRTLAPAATPFLALLPLMVLAQRFMGESDQARWPDVLRVAADLICWATFLADLGDLLVYSPSGRGSTPAESIGKAMTSCAAPLVGCFFFFTAGTKLVEEGQSHRQDGVLACGYDLRATPSRCPECGKPTGR